MINVLYYLHMSKIHATDFDSNTGGGSNSPAVTDQELPTGPQLYS